MRDVRSYWYQLGKNYARKYNLTLEDWADMIMAQNGSCADCRGEAILLCVDHDHSCCGLISKGCCVRDLVCKPCNNKRRAQDRQRKIKKILEHSRS